MRNPFRRLAFHRPAFAPHARSFAFGVSEQIVYPVLMFLSTPVFIRAIGKEQFGLWLLLASVVALVTVAGFGMATATTKFVAEFRGRGDHAEVAAVVRHTLAFSLMGGLALAVPLALAAPWLATTVFAKMGDPRSVTAVLWVGAIAIVLSQVDGTFLAALRGHERFGTVATVEAVLKIVSTALMIVVALATHSLGAILVASLVFSLAGTVIRAVIARRVVGPGILRPQWSRKHAREVWTFGGWNWLNTMSSILFVHLDRFVVGSVLGAAALAQYGICLQLASQIHGIPAAGLSFLLPLISRKVSQGGAAAVARARGLAFGATAVLAGGFALALVLFGGPILDLWVGHEIRTAIAEPFLLAVLCYFLLALNIGPYFVLLGQGHARFVSVVSLGGSALAAGASFLLVPAFGLAGGIAAKTIYSVVMLVLVVRLFRPARLATSAAPS